MVCSYRFCGRRGGNGCLRNATAAAVSRKKNSYLNYNNNTSCTTADGFAKLPKLRDKRVAEGNGIARFIKTVGGSRFQYVYTRFIGGGREEIVRRVLMGFLFLLTVSHSYARFPVAIPRIINIRAYMYIM